MYAVRVLFFLLVLPAINMLFVKTGSNSGVKFHIYLLQEVFGSDLPQHRPHGVLGVEYNGIPAAKHDGVCLNILVSIRPPLEEVLL
jgi:hypothetical protein